MTTVSDEHLKYWAERYVDSNLDGVISFSRFLALAPNAREQRLQADGIMASVPDHMARRELSPVMRGDCLIKPIHHRSPRRFRRPWFFNRGGH